jgi:hypothetical protein
MSVIINGSAGVTTNTGAVYDSLQRATAVASTSGTSIDFTSIPSWARRITVMLAGVSLSGSDSIQIQLGSGSFTTSGYSGGGARLGAASVAAATFTTGFALNNATAASLISGNITITNVTGNTWSATGLCGETSGEFICMVGGFIALSGTLDRLRVTTNGSNTFDAGTINIIYE